MSFSRPLALPVAVRSPSRSLLLYFLKVRRREATVSSLLLWDPALRDREASTFFQRLQRDPLLILQILALLALTLALARPAITVMGQGNKRVVVVLDTSASMKATDVSPVALRRRPSARRSTCSAGSGEGAEVMVIEAGVQPRVVAPFSRERDQTLAGHPRGPRATDLPNRLGEAVRTARALVGAGLRGRRSMSSPTAPTRPPLRGQADDVRVRWVGVGQRGQQRRHHQPVGAPQLFRRVRLPGVRVVRQLLCRSRRPSRFSLTLDGETLAEKSLTLEPTVRRAIVLPFTHVGRRRRCARGSMSPTTSRPTTPPTRSFRPCARSPVLLVSPGNLFLEKALSRPTPRSSSR